MNNQEQYKKIRKTRTTNKKHIRNNKTYIYIYIIKQTRNHNIEIRKRKTNKKNILNNNKTTTRPNK